MTSELDSAERVRAAGRGRVGVERLRAMVSMRDGVRLATDIYVPASESAAPRPVVFERSPYDIRADRFSDGVHASGDRVTPVSGASYFIDRGFVVVRQDCRGRGDSEGVFEKYLSEPEDGVDALDWIAEQPWCDGTIVTMGVSYSAHVQTAAAALGTTRISAMILDSGGFADAYETGGRFGGAYELKQVLWAYGHARTSASVRERPGAVEYLAGLDLHAWFSRMPWRQGDSPLAPLPDFERYIFEQWQHESRDEFWKRPALYGKGYYENFPTVPTIAISSWYDPYIRTAIDNYTAMRAKGAPAHLLLGPWTHGARSRSYAGDVDFGSAAVFEGNLGTDYLEWKADWYTDVLAGRPATGVSPVSFFLMGGGPGLRNAEGRMEHGGRWETTDSWPPSGARPVSWHLTPKQGFSGEAVAGDISYEFDPRDPVPSLGGGITSGEPLVCGGAFDQTPTERTPGAPQRLPLSARPDVVAFRSEPLSEPLAVAGPVVVTLEFSSSAPDTDVTVKLIDEYPPNEDYPAGFAMNVADGMLRCRFRNGFETAELMNPGERYRLMIPMPDTANLFAPGHRLRVDVSSSNFPRVDVNPNTGKPVVGDRTWQIARNTIHCAGSTVTLSAVDPVR